ncbi:MAG TPA: SDR family oxidoreductase [Desulfobacteraceae bacterium]|nr:SDR family oxidoreductase [Desulfobacteraceae bacterium]
MNANYRAKTASLFCHDLPTRARTRTGRVLVTGATGYIGGRLVSELMARGYTVRIMVRMPSSEHAQRWPGAEIVLGDALSPPCLVEALEGVSVAYYLIHSLLLGPRDVEAAETIAAANFRRAAEICHLDRIIYLGGLGDVKDSLSRHLRSRHQVAVELRKGSVPVTVLRAAVIVGSGSAAFEIIKALVHQAPFIPMPSWTSTRCQPIGIRDVIKYLVGVLELPRTAGDSFDIGGPETLTYRQMMETMAAVMGVKQRFISSPFTSVTVNAYLTSLITPVPAPITRCLLEGIVNEVVCRNHTIGTLIPMDLVSYEETLARALAREELETVTTRWSDAYPRDHAFAVRLHQLPRPPLYRASAAITSEKDPRELFRSVCTIGGKRGWFTTHHLWRLRGMADRLMLGVGIARGRKSLAALRVNDVIDFWRVEQLEKDEKLLLRAEMKLPGLAWLEFTIRPRHTVHQLSVTGYFDPRGMWGKPYWYLFLPFHHFIFHDLICQIEKNASNRNFQAETAMAGVNSPPHPKKEKI